LKISKKTSPDFYHYELGLSDDKRTELGIVYTPQDIVDFINQRCLNLWTKSEPPRVVDPCCGTGIFLHDMANKISARWSLDIEEVYEKYVFGIDIDAPAIVIAKELMPGVNLTVSNSLFEDLSVFDMVVTNPPYIRIQNLGEADRDKIKENFTFCVGDTDIYIAFFEKIIRLDVVSGFICPNSWIKNKSSMKLRDFLKKDGRSNTIIDFGFKKVFPKADAYTSILISDNKTSKKVSVGNSYKSLHEIPQKDLYLDNILLIDSSQRAFVSNILKRKKHVFDICDIKTGLATLADSVFLLEKIENREGMVIVRTRGQDKKEYEIEEGILKKCVKAGEITKNKQKKYCIIFPYKGDGNALPEDEIEKLFPKAYQYLESNKEKLLARDKGKGKGYLWHQYGRSQAVGIKAEKLVFATLVSGGMKMKDSPPEETLTSGYCIVPKEGYNIQDIRKIFESEEVTRWISIFGKNFGDGWVGVSKETFRNYKINENN